MKTFIVLALLAVICAAEDNEQYAEAVNVVEDLGYIPDDNVRVNFVDNFDADENIYQYEPIAPGELEVPLVSEDIVQENDPDYPYRPHLDPMWR